MNLRQKWIQHLRENNMTYVQHFKFAVTQGIRCIKAGFFLISHALIPALFAKTGSNLVNELNTSFIDHNEWIKFQSEQKQSSDS